MTEVSKKSSEESCYDFDAPRMHRNLKSTAGDIDDGADEWFDEHVDTATPRKHSSVFERESFGGTSVPIEYTSEDDGENASPSRKIPPVSTVTPRRADRRRMTRDKENTAASPNRGRQTRAKNMTKASRGPTRVATAPQQAVERRAPSSRLLAQTTASRSRAEANAKKGAKKMPVARSKALTLTVPITPECMRRSQRAAAAMPHPQDHGRTNDDTQLRSHKPVSSEPLKLTVPVTPNFMRRANSRPRKGSALASDRAQVPEKPRAPTSSRGKQPTLTMPVTPNCLKHAKRGRSKPMLSSEEQELLQIEEERAQKGEERVRFARAREQLSTNAGYLPVRSNKALTEPHEFDFARSHPMKMRRRTMDRRVECLLTNTHLRHYTPKAKNGRRSEPKLTEPVPFNFHKTARGRPKSANDGPKRNFAATLRHAAAARTSGRSTNALTIPMSPQLHKSRRQAAVVPSQGEREEALMQSIEPFKAQPVNHKIMASRGQYGVPKIPKKALTQPQDFQFVSESRLHNNGKADTEEFRQAPPPPQNSTASLTVPQSPALRTRSRKRAKPATEEPESAHTTFVANPIPDYDQMGGVHAVERKELTRPEPFSFEAADKARKVRHDDRVAEAQRQTMAMSDQFRANPLPSDTPDRIPAAAKRSLTVPQEFDLQGVKRAKMAKEAREENAMEVQEAEKSAREFRAQSCTVLDAAPFSARRSDKTLTEPEAFHLSSEFRGQERQKYDSEQNERRVDMDREKAALDAENERIERAEVRKLRSQRTFRANAIPNYKTLDIHPSTKELTEPVSPVMSTRQRTVLGKMR